MGSNRLLSQTRVARHHCFSLVRIISLLVSLLALATCSQTSLTSNAPSPITTVPATPTAVSAPCDARFGSVYVTTLPDATYQHTTVYAQVPLPAQTRSYNDDASGLRGRFLCSAGTTDSVLAFMTQHLTQLGWQQLASAVTDCGRAAIPRYAHPQCWKNGKYQLFLGVNGNADWVIAYIDPAFVTETRAVLPVP